MEFYNKLESFFYQLQFGLAIDPDGYFIGKHTFSCLMLSPEIFFTYKSKLQFDYPFNHKIKASELYSLFKNENISSSDVFEIIEELKKQYWLLPPSLTAETEMVLKKAVRNEWNTATEIELNSEVINYINHLEHIRNGFLETFTSKLTEVDTNQNYVEEESKGQYYSDMIQSEFETIKDCFIIESDYEKTMIILQNYFSNNILDSNEPIRVRKGNKRKISRCLGQIYRVFVPHSILTYDYLKIYPLLFNCFSIDEIDLNQTITSCKLYKYSMG